MSFSDMHLQPKLINNLTHVLEWTTPMEVQRLTIPLALAGRDLLIQSVTGSGKTGAFAIPLVQRLVLRGKYQATTVLVVSPTRELAEQTAIVFQRIAQGLPVSVALVCGGQDFKNEAQVLHSEPDVVVCTPGRLVDHLVNSSMSLGNLEALVLDEADKLLELGFQKQLEEIIKAVPAKRQTMLFSATLGEAVDRLASLSLQKPLRVNVDASREVNKDIVQEFIFLKQTDDMLVSEKAALVHQLLTTTFENMKTIVFCENRQQLSLLESNLLAADFEDFMPLSSDLTQKQRHQTIEDFTEAASGTLLATDLASRGLDISGIDAVILVGVPKHPEEYIHRVGRTGRAGAKGNSVCIGKREEIRELIKALGTTGGKAGLKERIPDAATYAKNLRRFSSPEHIARVKEIAKEQRLEKQMAVTDENLKKFDSGAPASEPRSWFLSDQDRKAVQEVLKRTDQGQLSKKEATDLLRAKKIKAELLKTERARRQAQKSRSETHSVTRKLKAQVRDMKKQGDYSRKVKLDARGKKK